MEQYQGMSNVTGERIADTAHIRQSIRDIIMTPIGTRVMRRDYGCGLFYLLDQPINGLLIAMAQAQIAQALMKYEPRISFSRVKVVAMNPGELVLEITGQWVETGQLFELTNDKINF